MRPMAMILVGRGVGSLRRQRAFGAPHAFQAIEFPRIGAEQVDHKITRINQHPIARGLNGIALDVQSGLAERFIQMRRHGLQLALNLAGRDDQPVRVIGAASHVQNHNVFGLVVFQALACGLHKYFQPVRCNFFAAPAAGGTGRCDLGGGFRLWLGLRLWRGLAGLGGRLWCWLSRGGFGGSALRRWRSSRCFRHSLAGLGGRLWCWLSRGGFGGGGLRRWRGSRCFRHSLAGLGGRLWCWLSRGGFGDGALRRWRSSRCFRRSLAGLGGRLWCWLSHGGFGGSAFRRWLGGSDFQRSLAGLGGRLYRWLSRGGFGGSDFRRGLRLWFRFGFRLGARLCLGRSFGFWLGGDAPLWAFFSRGGLAGYGRLLFFNPSVTGAALPP